MKTEKEFNAGRLSVQYGGMMKIVVEKKPLQTDGRGAGEEEQHWETEGGDERGRWE